MIKNIIIVALGGAAGSVARCLVSKAVQGTLLSAFPLGTMAVNVAGCLLIGLAGGLASGPSPAVGQDMKLLLTTGFCGGFTTFSTFMNEAFTLGHGGNPALAALYVGASIAAGLLAVPAGCWLARALQ